MRTDLAYINDTIESELALEERGELPPLRTEPTAATRVRGFALPAEVTQPLEAAALLNRRKTTISEYRKNASELRVKLMAAGIEPLAVLPQSAWIALCEGAGLYLMAPDPHGKVNFSDSLFAKMRARRVIVEWLAAVVAFLTTAAVCVYPLRGWFFDAWDFGQVFALIVIGVVALVGARVCYDLLHPRLDRASYRACVQRYLQTRTWPQILRDLAPNGRLWSGHVQCEIALPDPPVDVARTILALQKGAFNIRVAAEADAISPVGGIKKLFDTEYDAMIQREEAARRDPIIYVCHGQDNVWIEGRPNDAVAIVAQYGDFPIEREVVDRLIASRKII